MDWCVCCGMECGTLQCGMKQSVERCAMWNEVVCVLWHGMWNGVQCGMR